jgi:hypothetical protein
MAIIKRTAQHPNMAPWQKYGTAFFIKWSNDNGVMPTRNFQTTHFEHVDGIDGDKLVETRRTPRNRRARTGRAREHGHAAKAKGRADKRPGSQEASDAPQASDAHRLAGQGEPTGTRDPRGGAAWQHRVPDNPPARQQVICVLCPQGSPGEDPARAAHAGR